MDRKHAERAAALRSLGETLERALQDTDNGMSFSLLVFELRGDTAFLAGVSNAEPREMIVALRAYLAKLERVHSVPEPGDPN